jgi:hypothetical protein
VDIPQLIMLSRRMKDVLVFNRFQGFDRAVQSGGIARNPTVLPSDLSNPVFMDVRIYLCFGNGSGVSYGRCGITHHLACSSAENESFQQRIARQAVRAMHAGAGSLSGREQTRNAGPPIRIRSYSAHRVVRRRMHRNRSGGYVHAMFQTCLIHAREATADESRIHVGEIQKDV